MNQHDPKFILAHNAGALVSRRCRESRTTVTMYDGRVAGLDVSGPDDEVWPWATVCEQHATLVQHKTKQAAMSYLSHPLDWCDRCNGSDDGPDEDNEL